MASLFVAGYPHTVGGAGPHLWALIRAWRSVGIDVCLLSKEGRDDFWYPRLKALGCRFAHAKHQWDVPEIEGQTVAAFCSKTFARNASKFQDRGCKIVWSGAMTFFHGEETVVHVGRKFDRVILNSAFQESRLRKQLEGNYGYDPTHVVRIPTAFWPDEWNFAPKPITKPFVIGRLSRAAPDKYDRKLWRMYGAIWDKLDGDVLARVMAWDKTVERHCGKPPEWAECLKAKTETAEDFLHSLHCLVFANGSARENRSRAVMEAMACGVPVIVRNHCGFPEQVIHGETGYLCDTDEQFVEYAVQLARDESLRLRIAEQARENLSKIADNHAIALSWKAMLEELTDGKTADAA